MNLNPAGLFRGKTNTSRSEHLENLVARPLGPSEELMWRMSGVGSLNIVVTARIHGGIDQQQLRRALRALQERHFLLNVAIKPAGSSADFIYLNARPIPLRDAGLSPWVDVVADEANDDIDCAKGPLVRATILRDVSSTSILLTFNHAIADGTSAVVAMRDLLRLYASGSELPDAAEPIKRTSPQTTPDHLLPARVKGLRLAAISPAFILRQMKAAQTDVLRIGNAVPVGSSKRTCYLPRQLEPEQTSALLRTTRQQGATIQGVVCAALMLEIKARSAKGDDRPVGCLNPLNLRSQLTGDVSNEMGFYVSRISTLHEIKSNTGIWDLARDTSSQLSDPANRADALTASALQKYLLQTTRRDPETLVHQVNAVVASTTVVTNLGRLDVETRFGELELLDLHFVVAGNAFPGTGCGIMLTTFDEHMTLNVGYGEDRLSKEDANAIASGVVSRLIAAADG